jgi:hypothetical protein
MAQANFDFQEFSSKKVKEYLKEYCKPALMRKASAGILMIDYKMAGKKYPVYLYQSERNLKLCQYSNR